MEGKTGFFWGHSVTRNGNKTVHTICLCSASGSFFFALFNFCNCCRSLSVNHSTKVYSIRTANTNIKLTIRYQSTAFIYDT